MTDEEPTYTTEGGVVLTLQTISPFAYQAMLRGIREKIEALDDPAQGDMLLGRNMIQFFISRGVKLEVSDNGWQERQRWEGIEIPTEPPAALKVHYVETEILQSFRDLVGLMLAIMRLTGISEQAMASISESMMQSIVR